ncbi:MAG: hypothetical protein ABIH04_05490 [Planctomycetota bacterium]
MKFRNAKEAREAEVAIVLYLTPMVKMFEEGLRTMRVKILRKYLYQDDKGGVDPAYLLEGGSQKFEFRLGNALLEFISIDREEKPLRFDFQINDSSQAEEKLIRIIAGRLEIARAFVECESQDELKKRLEGMANHFEKVRFWSFDDPKKGDGE